MVMRLVFYLLKSMREDSFHLSNANIKASIYSSQIDFVFINNKVQNYKKLKNRAVSIGHIASSPLVDAYYLFLHNFAFQRVSYGMSTKKKKKKKKCVLKC